MVLHSIIFLKMELFIYPPYFYFVKLFYFTFIHLISTSAHPLLSSYFTPLPTCTHSMPVTSLCYHLLPAFHRPRLQSTFPTPHPLLLYTLLTPLPRRLWHHIPPKYW